VDVTLRTLRDDDLDAYLELREHSFGYPPGDDVRTELRGRMPLTVGAFDATGRLVASAARPRFETYVAGRRQPLLGIAAVQTSLPARRRGVARSLLVELLADGREDGIGWSLLYPFDPRFYDRLGWQSLPTGVRLGMDIAWLEPPRPVDARPIGSDLRGALHELHQRCAAQWNFSNARTVGPWDVWSGMLPEPGGRGAAYRVEDGYAVVRLRQAGGAGTTLDVIDAAWCSPGGRGEVLALLAAYAGQADRVEIEVPRDEALAWSFADWFPMPTHATRMARVVDVTAALAPLVPYDDVRACTVRVRDASAPWNDGTWRITPGDAGCAVAPSSDAAEATLDVRALPLLVGGAATPEAVVRAGLADGDRRALATLAALSAGRTPFQSLNDRF
jgi:predicted acetyltransferase